MAFLCQNAVCSTFASLSAGGIVTANITLITSCKGGVGKSTAAANLAIALARRGRKVLLADCNFDMRCLDLLLGVENDIVYDMYDAAKRRVPIERTFLRDGRSDNLWFLAAPYKGGGEITGEEFRNMLEAALSYIPFDCILLDTPGSLVVPAILESKMVNGAVIVASHQPSSIRAAEQTGEYLVRNRIVDQRLLINSFDFEGALNGNRPGINEIIDRSFIQLGGIIPYERELMIAAEKGQLACQLKKSNAATAFENIAKRLDGRFVPLFYGFTGMKTKRQIAQLLR